GDHAAFPIDCDALLDLDAKIACARPTEFERLQEFRMGGNAGATADQFHGRTLVNVCLPSDLAQEGCTEQAGHRPADDDGALRTGLRSAHTGIALPTRRQPLSAALSMLIRSRLAHVPEKWTLISG